MTKLITRLVDQTGQSNIGRTVIPSGYESSAPRFKLTFQKNTRTVGYYSSALKKYTAYNVNLFVSY
jgi:hypothetical protein